MTDSENEIIQSVSLEDGEVPSDETLRGLSGLSRADATELTAQWDAQPVSLVRETLARLGEISASDRGVEFDELFTLCLLHDDDEIRECAVVALTGNGDSRMLESFSDLLRNDPVESVRESAALALGAYAELAEDGRLMSHRLEQLCDTLVEATGDASVSVAGAALVAYAGMPAGSPTEVIEAWCDRSADDATMMSYAIAAMGRSGERQWFQDIRAAMDHPSARVREAATQAFGELANPDDDLECIDDLLDDYSLEVQLAAVTALRMLGSSEARELLAKVCANNPEPSVQESALSALLELKDDDDLRHAVTPEMEESGLYGGGGTALERSRDIGRYDAPTEEGWGLMSEEDYAEAEGDEEDSEELRYEDIEELEEDEDIGEDLEDWYESDEFHRGMG